MRPLVLAILASTLLFPTADVSAQGTATIIGRVESADTRIALTGAHVALLGTSLTTISDQSGTFRFTGVPAGSHRIRVAYLGRTPQITSINATSGVTVRLTIALEQVVLERVNVRAAGQAEALSRQQNAPNIKSVVAADQMGRFPDASAPEAAQRLPGVAVQRDQGEGRYVQIRGSSAATTQVTINGEQIGSPEADARQIALDAIPVGVLAAIEVSKAITPDMDADAIGGSVNLVTKRAAQGRTLTLDGAGGYAPIRSAGSGLGAITYGDRSANGRLGWLFSGSVGERHFGSDDIEPDYDDDELSELEVRHYTLRRRRTGATLSLDFDASDRSSFYINGLWSQLQDQEQRRALANIIEDGELAYLHKNRLENIGTINVLAGAEHRFRRGLRLDYRFGITQSYEDTPFDREVAFLREDVTFAPTRADVDRPQANPQVDALNSPYVFDELITGGTLTKNRDVIGAFNLSLPFRLTGEGSGILKTGLKVRDKNKDQRVDAFEVGPLDDDIVLGSDIGTRFDNAGFAAGRYAMPWQTASRDVYDFESRFAARLDEREGDLEAQTEAYKLRERILAGYVMAELNFNSKFLLLPGLRYEQTTLNTDGFAWDDEAETLTRQTGDNSYGNVFPMLHARYRVDDATNVRAAFTSTIFRPNFIDLVPYRIVDGDDVEAGNPSLQPTLARNFDLMAERYLRNIGLLSAGVFRKQLDKPIFLHTSDNANDGETTQPINATSGTITGFEVAWQQRLTFLPGALNGFGLYLNYTHTTSSATQPNGRTTRFAGQAENAYNVAVSYEKRGFSGQLSLNQVGSYIDELGSEDGDDLFADRRTQLDLSASYFVTPSVQLYVDALNLTNAPYRTYQGRVDLLRQREFYRASVQLGLRYRP